MPAKRRSEPGSRLTKRLRQRGAATAKVSFGLEAPASVVVVLLFGSIKNAVRSLRLSRTVSIRK